MISRLTPRPSLSHGPAPEYLEHLFSLARASSGEPQPELPPVALPCRRGRGRGSHSDGHGHAGWPQPLRHLKLLVMITDVISIRVIMMIG